jgi:hypothetical protein
MKLTGLVAASLALSLAAVDSAEARPKPRGFQSSKSFEANKTFGLGLELGAPSGITGKLFLSDSGALQFGLGAIYGHYYGGDGLHLYVDYVMHPIVLASTDAFELPFYVGVGGRFWDFDYCRAARDCGYGGTVFGVRVPLGLAFDFNRVPLDIFIQLVPTIDFYRGYRYRDRSVWIDFDLSLGVRYWFN